MTRIEADTRAAFARADEESDDHRAVALLARDALGIFGRHHVAMRTFLVELRDVPAVRDRTVRSSHLLAETVAGWLVRRTGTSRARAEAAYRLLFSIGAGEALFTGEQVSAAPLDRADLEVAVTRALLAVVGE